MRPYSSKKLNIPRLLALGELDIRGIAASNPQLSAREYFSRVEWFIEDAPQYAADLCRASDAQVLQMIKEALNRIGYPKLETDIQSMIEEIDGPALPGAESRHGRIADSLNQLHEKLLKAYTVKNRRYAQVSTERFIEQAPCYLEQLYQVTEPERLQEIKNVLSILSHDRLPPDFKALVNEIGTAPEILPIADKLQAYYERIKEAYVRINSEYSQPEPPAPLPDAEEGEVLLGEALEALDFEEAHRKLRILAVDDIATVLNSVTSVLSPHYEVFALTKAAQVEKFLAHTTPELFLLDIEMPELSGYDLVSVIRSFKEHQDTPIIFLTGSATLSNIRTAVSLGASDFISKPIDREILLKKIADKIVWKKAF